MIKKIIAFFKWWWKEQEKLCPHCGYYCTGRTIWCLPPIAPEKDEDA